MTSVVEYDKKIRDKKAELSRLERDYKQQGNAISGKERILKQLRANLSDLEGDIARETDEFAKRRLEGEHEAITKSLESDIKSIETLKSERAILENKIEVTREELSLLDSERLVQAGVERAEKYEADVAAEFAIINKALSKLSKKINAIDKKEYPEVAKSGHILLTRLTDARNDYKAALDAREDAKIAGDNFVKACNDAIKIASPKLEKALGWKDSFKNLLKAFANAVIAIARKGDYFEYKQSESLKAVGIFKTNLSLKEPESKDLEDRKGHTPK